MNNELLCLALKRAGFFSFDYIVMDSIVEWGQNSPFIERKKNLLCDAGHILTGLSMIKHSTVFLP